MFPNTSVNRMITICRCDVRFNWSDRLQSSQGRFLPLLFCDHLRVAFLKAYATSHPLGLTHDKMHHGRWRYEVYLVLKFSVRYSRPDRNTSPSHLPMTHVLVGSRASCIGDTSEFCTYHLYSKKYRLPCVVNTISGVSKSIRWQHLSGHPISVGMHVH